MTATNHALTGAIIGLTIDEPWLALPVAFLSHFVCDAIPHFGVSSEVNGFLRSNRFRLMLMVDGGLCVILVICLAIIQPKRWLQAAICAFLATSPDLVWINRFRLNLANKPWHPNLFSRFAAKIQWFERPSGAIVEVVWFIAAVTILVVRVHQG